MGLIDAAAIEKVFEEKHLNRVLDSDRWLIADIKKSIMDLPTIDAVPVKRGEWVEYPYCLCYEGALTEEDIACSSCGAVFNVIDNCTEKFKYCPNCGAYMGTGND